MYANANITIGVIVAALSYSQALTEPLNDLLYCINSKNSVKDVVDDLNKFFDNTNEDTEFHAMKKMNEMLKLDNTRVVYEDKSITYNITIKKDKKYVICGASGIGKSALFNILTNRVAYEGDIYVDNTKAVLQPDDICYISQREYTFAEDYRTNVTVFDSYVLYNKELENQFKKIDIMGKIENIADATKLSGGEKQLLHMIRMAVINKKIILLDEPFSAMDIQLRKRMLDILKDIKATILLITHSYDDKEYSGWERINMGEVVRLG